MLNSTKCLTAAFRCLPKLVLFRGELITVFCFPSQAFLGFVFAAQTTGKGPIDALTSHLADPFSNNWAKNIGNCALDAAATLPGGVTIPTPCLWPGN